MSNQPHENVTAKSILGSFHKIFLQPAEVKNFNPVVLRCHLDQLEIVLPVGEEVRLFRRVESGTVDFVVNNADGMDIPLSTSASVLVHLGEQEFTSTRQDLDILDISRAVQGSVKTKRGQQCKNRTRHHSGRCHFHR